MKSRGLTLGMLLSCFIITAAPAQSWTSNFLAHSLSSVAMSADGSFLLGAAGDIGAFISTNSGSTWAHCSSGVITYGGLAACSADGKTLFVANGSPSLPCSTNSGQDWFAVTTNGPGINGVLAASADARVLVAGVNTSGLYISTNGGRTWRLSSVANWACAAPTADGAKWFGSPGIQGLFNSTDYGVTWKTNIPYIGFRSVACSADGKVVVAVTFANPAPFLCVSTNGGVTWRTNSAPVPYNTPHVTGSADLRNLAYWLNGGLGNIYTSTNFGASWITNDPPLDSWTQVLVSADGNRMVAFKNGSMWVRNDTSAPCLNLQRFGSSLAASWLVPSTPLQLQQASSTLTPSWIPVTNTPTLNLSTLNNETLLSPDQDSAFFRLASPQ